MSGRMPRVGDVVRCQADRGDAPYTGLVEHVSNDTQTNIHGVRYVWVTVRHPGAHASVWPSHRIGYTLPA